MGNRRHSWRETWRLVISKRFYPFGMGRTLQPVPWAHLRIGLDIHSEAAAPDEYSKGLQNVIMERCRAIQEAKGIDFSRFDTLALSLLISAKAGIMTTGQIQGLINDSITAYAQAEAYRLRHRDARVV